MLNYVYFLNVRKVFRLDIKIGCGKLNTVRGSVNHFFKILLLLSRRRRLRFIDILIRETVCILHFIKLGLVNWKVSKVFFLKDLCAFLKGLQLKESSSFLFFRILELFRKFTIHFPMIVEFIRKLKFYCGCDFSLLFLKVLLMQLLSCLELLQLICQLILYFIEGANLRLQLLLEFYPSPFTYLDLSFKLVYLRNLVQAYPFICISKVFKLYLLLLHFFLSLTQLIFKL